MAKKVLFNGDLLKTDDWGGPLEKSGVTYDAASGTAVQNYIKSTLNSKIGYMVIPDGKTKYYCFADEDDYELWVSDPETYDNLVIAKFDAPAMYKAEITLLNGSTHDILLGDENNYINYSFEIKENDSVGKQVLEDVSITYTITNSGTTQTVTETYTADKAKQTISFNVDSYIKEGTNIIRIDLVSGITETRTAASVTYTVISYTLHINNFDISTVWQGDSITVPYYTKGNGDKYAEWWLDGVKLDQKLDEDVVKDLESNKNRIIDISSITENGVHSLQLKGYIKVNGVNYYSNLYYRQFIVHKVDELQQSIAISVDYDRNTEVISGTPTLPSGEQYTEYSLKFAAYHSNSTAQATFDVKKYFNEELLSTEPTSNNTVYNFKFTPTIYGSSTIKLNDDSYNINIVETTKDIREITNELKLNLRALGKNNSSETERSSWTYGDITTTFSGFAWTVNDGWDEDNNRLIIGEGSSIEVSYAPFNYTDGNNVAKTLEFEIGTKDVTYDDEVICDMTTTVGSVNVGLKITASEISLTDSAGNKTSTRFKSDKTYRITLVIYPKTTSERYKSLVMLYVDGCVCGVMSYGSNNFISNKNIKFSGSSKAKVIVKHIRCYDATLTYDQVLNNYILYRDTVTEMNDVYDRNNIYNTSKTEFEPSLVANNIPVLLITGDIPTFENFTSKDQTIDVDIEYINTNDETKNFKWTGVLLKPQGTSSMNYPIKNLRPYIAKNSYTKCYDWQGNLLSKNKYAFKTGSQAVKVWTIKADFAESSSTHNTGTARLWNDCLYNASDDLKTEAQKAALENEYDYDVRTTVDGFPVACFYRLNATDSYKFMGKYNFNNDKSSESVFGFCDIPGFNEDMTNVDENEKGCYIYARNSDTETLESMKTRFLAEAAAGTLKSDASIYTLQTLEDNLPKSTSYTRTKDSTTGVWSDWEENDLNPVECWEILDSGNPYALYQTVEGWYTKDTSGTYAWEGAFEARFPDVGGEANTINLYRFVKWLSETYIKSDDEDAVKTQKITKFKNEYSSYFDTEKMLAYYDYLMRFGAVDQTTKNAMLTTEDGQHWFFINYDNDTILGVRNDGLLVYGPEIDRQTKWSGETDYAYAGHESVLWNNIERLLGYLDKDETWMAGIPDTTFLNTMLEVDGSLTTLHGDKMSLRYDQVIDMYNNKQSGQWCERIYNRDAQRKYIDTWVDSGKSYLSSLQGPRTSHREWWLSKRFSLYDSKWLSGDYENNFMYFLAAQPETKNESYVTIYGANKLYYAYAINTDFKETGVEIDPNTSGKESHTFHHTSNLQIGNPFRIYPVNSIKKLDLSHDTLFPYIKNIYLKPNASNDGPTSMEELLIGRSDLTNTQITTIGDLDKSVKLKVLDIRGLKGVYSLDSLSSLMNLKTLKASNSGLNTLTLENSSIQTLELPSINTLSLTNCKHIDTITFDDITAVHNINIVNCNYTFKNEIIAHSLSTNSNINIEGIDWELDSIDVLKNIYNYYKTTGNFTLKGHIHLNTALTDADITWLDDNIGAWYSSTSSLYVTAKDTVLLKGPDTFLEGTSGVTYKLYNLTGNEGTVTYLLSNSTYQSIDANGVITSINAGVNRTVTVTGMLSIDSNTYIDTKDVAITGKVYPSSVNFDVGCPENLTEVKDYEYSIRFDQEYTGVITNYNWELVNESEADVELKEEEETSVILRVNSIPQNDKSITLKYDCTWDKAGGNAMSCNIVALVKAYVYPTALTINGETTINEDESDTYSINLDIIPTGEVNYKWTLETIEGSATAIMTPVGTTATIVYSNINNVNTQFKLTMDITKTGESTPFLSNYIIINALYAEPVIRSAAGGGTANEDYIYKICYAEGWCKKDKGMYASECAAVDDIGIVFSPRTTNKYYLWAQNITDLSYLQYFTRLTSIPDYAFYADSRNLQTIVFPANIESIGTSAFQGCFGLVNVDLGRCSKLKYIGVNAFYYCNSLVTINFIYCSNLETIDSGCFNGCSALTTVNLSNTKLEEISAGCFAACTNLTTVNLPSGLKRIMNTAFQSCEPLTDLALPNSIEEIHDSSFYNCRRLTIKPASGTVLLPNLKLLDNGAFMNSLNGVVNLSECTNLTTIGIRCFYCDENSSEQHTRIQLVLPNSITSLQAECLANIWISQLSITDNTSTHITLTNSSEWTYAFGMHTTAETSSGERECRIGSRAKALYPEEILNLTVEGTEAAKTYWKDKINNGGAEGSPEQHLNDRFKNDGNWNVTINI